jgi:hypothetical protein
MPRVSPTLEGFRATFRRPSLIFAEIAWRWTVGAAAWALVFFWLIEFLNTLPVSNGDLALLSTRQPFLVGRAIAHILRGSLSRAVLAAMVAVIAMSLLWIVAASVGRIATVRLLLEQFRSDAGNPSVEHNVAEPRPLRALMDLNCLRATLMLAAMLAILGAGFLAGFVSPPASPRPGLAFVLFLPLGGLVCILWWMLNWMLSLAGIFAVRDGDGAMNALSAAVAFVRSRLGPVSAVSTWIGLGHSTAFSIAGTAASLPLAFIRVAPPRLVIASEILVALAYFAVVDWLYMARLAGYVCIAEMPEAPVALAPLPVPPPQTSIDRDELILGDVPNLAMET